MLIPGFGGTMRIYDLIYAKKTGQALSREQIAFWVQGVTEGSIPPEQSAALLMAICWRGMDARETLDLTLAMRDSGSRWTSTAQAVLGIRPR